MANDFQEKKESRLKTNYREIGRSGTFITGNVVQNDYLNEMIGVPAQEIFHKMLLSDSQIRKIYHAVSNPIKSATWSIEPVSDDPMDIEVAALIEQIIFKDLPNGWKSKLDEILTFPWHGHAVFEIIHKNYSDPEFGDYTGLANIAFRDQRTLDYWKYSQEGILQSIHQIQSGDIEIDVDIPAENLLIFYNEKKGNDSGYPFCRMLYGNYKRKLLYKQLQAIGIERSAIPVPHLKLPQGVDYNSDEYADAVNQLQAFTQAENAFFVTPSEYELNLNPATGFNPAYVQSAIKAENEEIAGSLVAMWLEMGIGGNSAVGSSTFESLEFFRDGIEYLADKISDPFNLYLIPNLVALNYGDSVTKFPKLSHAGIADDAGKELMEIVTGYVSTQVITPDEQLEDHIRKVHNLPAKMEGTIIENQETDIDPASEDDPEDEVELSTKKKRKKTAKDLIDMQADKVTQDLKNSLSAASSKYINDVMNRYKQLGDNRKQRATDKVKMGFSNNLKKDLKRTLTETASMAIAQARTEVPSKKDVELSNHERDMLRLVDKYGEDIKEIKLNDFSKLPAYVQVLIAKQTDLITESSMQDLKDKLDFTFSSIETKSKDENVIRQSMEDNAQEFIESNQLNTKGVNVSAIIVNEGRDAFFFEEEVLDEIHSFTFMNAAPKSTICRELAGTTFSANDAESLRYSPPLHHNCKSYLRANLKSSKGVDRLEVSTLSPTAGAKKSITL